MRIFQNIHVQVGVDIIQMNKEYKNIPSWRQIMF